MTQPPLAVTQSDGSRRYQNPRTGEIVPSVTTILRVLSKPSVENWKLRKTATYTTDNWDLIAPLTAVEKIEAITSAASDYTEERAGIGTLVHELVENVAKNNPAETTKETDGYLTQFTHFMITHRPVFLESEVTLWNRTREYAGTADLILRLGDDIILADIKTSRSGPYPEFALQLAALAGTEFMIRVDGTEEPLPAITGLAVLQLRPRSWHLIPVTRQDECYAAFLHCREVYRWQNEAAAHVFAQEAA